MERIKIGTGRLSWNGSERRMDRYGTVRLFGENDQPIPLDHNGWEGQFGELSAKVIGEPKKSKHVGDLARGIFPTTPKLNEWIPLGTGELFTEHYGAIHEKSSHERQDDKLSDELTSAFDALKEKLGDGVVVEVHRNENDEEREEYDQIGLRPLDDREKDWLDPYQLYRAHDQLVELYFEPMDLPDPNEQEKLTEVFEQLKTQLFKAYKEVMDAAYPVDKKAKFSVTNLLSKFTEIYATCESDLAKVGWTPADAAEALVFEYLKGTRNAVARTDVELEEV